MSLHATCAIHYTVFVDPEFKTIIRCIYSKLLVEYRGNKMQLLKMRHEKITRKFDSNIDDDVSCFLSTVYSVYFILCMTNVRFESVNKRSIGWELEFLVSQGRRASTFIVQIFFSL